jgi:hypothetical protein
MHLLLPRTGIVEFAAIIARKKRLRDVRYPATSTCSRRSTSPVPTTAGLSSKTTRSSPTASSATAASRCSRSSRARAGTRGREGGRGAGREVLDSEPIEAAITPREAHARGLYETPAIHLVRDTVEGGARAAIAAPPHRLVDTLDVGSQHQFYLEGQISYAVPNEDDGMKPHCSTPHPSELQHLVAHALGLQSNHVHVECRRTGGGFGGKESQSGLFACVAALAAQRTQKPVELRLDRDDDFLITGRRHCFVYDYEVGFDDDGRIRGIAMTMISRAGHSADLSGPVTTRALCHVGNAYWLADVERHGFSAKTNTRSNTAFRGFGGPQGAILVARNCDLARLAASAFIRACARSRSAAVTSWNTLTPPPFLVRRPMMRTTSPLPRSHSSSPAPERCMRSRSSSRCTRRSCNAPSSGASMTGADNPDSGMPTRRTSRSQGIISR